MRILGFLRYIFVVGWRSLFGTLPYFLLVSLPRLLSSNLPKDSLEIRWRFSPFYRLGAGLPVNKSTILLSAPDNSTFYCHLHDWTLFKEIYRQKVYDRFFEPKNSSIVVDVGANAGMYTIKAARQVGTSGRVISVEPHPYTYKLLVQNVRMNELTHNVLTVNTALADYEGKSRLYLDHRRGSGNSLLPISKSSIEVQVTTLDRLMNSLGFSSYDLLKIDVEGCELEVLRGAEETLKKAPMVVVAAYHFEEETSSVKSFLVERGFEVLVSKGMVYASRSISSVQKLEDSSSRIHWHRTRKRILLLFSTLLEGLRAKSRRLATRYEWICRQRGLYSVWCHSTGGPPAATIVT